MNILNVLKNHSDEEHRLSQQDIIHFLKEDYDMEAERKSIRRNIDNLLEEGYDIEYTETKRGKGKDANIVCTDFYLQREFEDSELRLIIDGLLFSKYIPQNQCKDLIKKLEGLSNEYFKSRVKYIETLKDEKKVNTEIFYVIEIIDEAIRKKCKISFNYCSYDITKKQVFRVDDEGNPKVYVVSPYQMAAANGRYYLICKHPKKPGISNFRVDRIKNIKITEEPVEKLDTSYSLPKHMVEHLYMMAGESDYVTFEFKKDRLNDVIDWFGTDINLTEKGDIIEGHCKVNLQAMKFWAMQYGDHIKVTKPETLVNMIKKTLKDMTKKYKG